MKRQPTRHWNSARRRHFAKAQHGRAFTVAHRASSLPEEDSSVRWLVLTGGVLTGVGSFVGMASFWPSPTWNRNEKIIAVLLLPARVVLPLFILIFSFTTRPSDCTSNGGPGQSAAVYCVGKWLPVACPGILIFLLLIVIPVIGTVHPKKVLRSGNLLARKKMSRYQRPDPHVLRLACHQLVRLPVDVSTMANGHGYDQQHPVINCVENPIVANLESVAIAAAQLSRSRGWRILREECNRSSDSRLRRTINLA